jgi:ABC-type molybdate transport system substrate-binding protein
MKYILIIVILYANLFAKNPYQVRYDKNNSKDVKEMETIQKKITENLGGRLNKFKKQNLKTVVQFEVIGNEVYYFKIIEKSNNIEYDRTIQDFLNEENGKKYYENPKFLRMIINLKP